MFTTCQMGRARLFRSALKARAVGYEPRASLVRLMTTGEGDLADEADAFLLACSAPRRGTGIGKISGLSEVEARKVAFAGVDRWVQLRGLVGAIEIFSLLGAWTPVALFPDEPVRVLAAQRLRQWLAHHEARDHALGFVRRSAGLPHGMAGWKSRTEYHAGHEAMAYLFPAHRAFFERAAEELEWHERERGELSPARTTLLLGAIQTAEDHARIATWLGDDDLDRHAVVIAHALGEAGLSVLVAHARRRPRSLGVARALTSYVCPEAAHALAQLAGHRPAHPILRDYFTAHPELATAIEPLVACEERNLRIGARVLRASVAA